MPRKKKIEKPASRYICVLEGGGSSFNCEGETVIECLEKLEPPVIKSRFTLTVKEGEKSAQVNLVPVKIKRLMVNKMLRQILEKQLLTQLS